MRVSIDERLTRLCGDFSVSKIGEWLERKFASYDTSKADVLSIAENKNDKEYFKSARLLGYVRDLPDGRSGAGNRPLLVAAVEMRKILTERTSRQAQFNFAKRVLQNAVRSGAAGLNGYPSQGLFFFYDNEQFFRISLVSGEMEGRKFKFNEAKRQSFYINPDRPNNIAKSRLSESIETYADLKEAFSVETLTKEFYGKLFEWYEWAMKPRTGVTFPNDDSTPDDDKKYNNESIIRLITRLMFTWFIRQRDMVKAELFTVEGVKTLLKNFDPKSMEDDNYYRCILQNLFFATFNCQPEKRKFIQRSFHGRSDGFGVKTLYRYEKEFKDVAAFKELVKRTPFLNCALFDCLDKQQRESEGGKLLLFDGFSDTRKRQAHVPNGLFFHPEKGIIPLFDTYEFTIDENNADDADVALDPELLGKVFENLLGAFNPETQETARKATGSFYTPREIVDYMVEESLKNHIKTKVPRIKDAWIEELFDKTAAAEKRELPFDDEIAAEIRESLYSCKILDPACGSGAFPMGILHCMVRLFSRLDPANIDLNKRLIMRYKQETNLPPDPLETAAEREERLEALKVQLDEGQHYPDYARKLYLIENCIYGVDIQPIATQISKLRFFISLLCDQLRENWNAESENHGLLSLPNLEAKFVCANTLISLPKTEGELELMSCSKIPKLREKLQENRHRIFAARTFKQKEKLKMRDLEIRDEIREAVRSTLAKPDKELIKVQEEVIAKLRKDRIPFETPKMVKQRRKVEARVQHSLFDVLPDEPDEDRFEEVLIDVNAEMREKIDAKISFAQQKIASENRKASPDNVLAIDQYAKQVAGWDPYDQNTSSSFFDPEWMFNISSGFDVVIGNPPYVRRTDISDSDKHQYEADYFSAKGQYDLYLLFTECGLNYLSEGGDLAFINPIRFFNADYGRNAREFIVKNCQIRSILDVSQLDVFQSVLTYPCVMHYCKNSCATLEENRIAYRKLDDFGFLLCTSSVGVTWLSQGEILKDEEFRIFTSTSEIREIIRKIDGCGYEVGKMFSVARGLPNKDINVRKDTFAALKSKGVLRYAIDGTHVVRVGTTCGENFASEMIIMPRTVKSIRATIKPKKLVLLDRIYYLDPFQEVNLKFVLGIINSKLTNFWFEDAYATTKVAGGYFDLNGNQIKSIKLPKCSIESEKTVSEIVGKVLAKKKINPDADTSALEAQIDQLVYKLYGLTDEEIAIVEGRGKSDTPKGEAAAKPSRRRTTRPATAADSPREEDEELE